MRIHTSQRQPDWSPTPSLCRVSPLPGGTEGGCRVSPLPGGTDQTPCILVKDHYFKGNDGYAAGLAAMVGVSAVGATAGFAAGYLRNPIAKAALGSFAGASAGLTGAHFLPKKPFLTVGLLGAVAGGVLAVKYPHPVTTGLLTLAGATLPAGLILGLLDGLD